jgi:2'-5' RNA ligase
MLLPAPIVHRITDWQRHALAGADVRVLSAEQLHITLVFLGSRPGTDLEAIGGVIARGASAARAPAFHASRYRETARVGMIQLREDAVGGEHYAGRANMFTGHLMRELESRRLYRREYRSWTPHISVSRFKRPPRLTIDPPDLGSFSPAGVGLFRSVPTQDGSLYEQLGAWQIPE